MNKILSSAPQFQWQPFRGGGPSSWTPRLGSEPIQGTAPVFMPYRWPTEGEEQAPASKENFQFQTIDLNNQLNELLELIDRIQSELVVNFAAQGWWPKAGKTPNIAEQT